MQNLLTVLSVIHPVLNQFNRVNIYGALSQVVRSSWKHFPLGSLTFDIWSEDFFYDIVNNGRNCRCQT
jgi:hypothetical protein